MEAGVVVSAGRSFCKAASTACKSSSKNAGSFIVRWMAMPKFRGASGFVAFGIERLGGELAVGFFQQDFDFSFGFFELLLALARKGDAFFEEFHRFVERKLRALQLADRKSVV